MAGALDLETYDIFSTKRQSRIFPTDAELIEHNWVASQGGGTITESEVLYHEEDCTGTDCILCSFEQELIRIGYHNRQTARKANCKKFYEHVPKQSKETKAQNQDLCRNYPPSADQKLKEREDGKLDSIDEIESKPNNPRSAGHSNSSLSQQRIVSSISETHICFNALVPNASEHFTKTPNAADTPSKTSKLSKQGKRQCEQKTNKSFLLHSVSFGVKTLNSPIILGQTENNPPEASPSSSDESNCTNAWRVKPDGESEQLVVGSTKLSMNMSSTEQNTCTSPEESVEIYLSDGSTPKVLSPDEPSPDGPTPKGSWCEISIAEGSTDLNLDNETDDEFEYVPSPVDTLTDMSRAASAMEQELWFATDFEDEVPMVSCSKSRARRRAISRSAGFLQQPPSRTSSTISNFSQSSLISMKETSLHRSKGTMQLNMTSYDRTNTPSIRISSAPSEYPSMQPRRSKGFENSPWKCPYTYGLSAILRHGSRTKHTAAFQLSPPLSSESTPIHELRSMPASPQTTPPNARPLLRSVRSSPGMRQVLVEYCKG